MGPSGTGKSTLARVIGLLRYLSNLKPTDARNWLPKQARYRAAPRERESSNQPTEQVLGILPPALSPSVAPSHT